MSTNNKMAIPVDKRLKAMILDHVLMTIIAMLFFLPLIISGFPGEFRNSPGLTSNYFNEGPIKYIGLFGIALYFCKDMVNGRSMAKRILGLQVVDNKTGKVATSLRCSVRNIFCILWIIEVFVAMLNTNKRIGDRVAGTRLEHYDPARTQRKPSVLNLVLSVLISFAVVVLLEKSLSFQ